MSASATPGTSSAKSKAVSSKPKSGIRSQKSGVPSPTAEIASPKTGAVSPRAGTTRSKTNLPKTKVGVPSPKHDDSSPRARIANPETGTVSPRDGTAKSKTNSPKKKSGALSPKPDDSSAGFGTASPKTGVASPKTGAVSPRSGAASPRAGIARKGAGASSTKAAIASPKSGAMSPKAGARSPMSGTAGTKSPDRGAASPIKASPSRSVSPKIKKGASKVKIGSPSRSPAAAGAKAKDGQNGEEPPKVTKSRPLDAVGRRKSVTAAAMFKMVRKSLRPQSAAEGNTGESSLSSKDQMSLVMVVTMAGFLFVFVITVTFFYLISGESIQEGVACITEECLKAQKYLDGLLNETKDPCVDFYGYVCDSWHQKGISFHTASVLSQLFRLNLTLFHKREEFRKDEQRQGMHILGPVYRQVPPVSSGHVEASSAHPGRWSKGGTSKARSTITT
ncbi:hypothetical protein V5799_016051 [Amblyomma americanum]|uniref:Peptidase M13 N-terminal domain-containing protein n=1 Tax=Amblyomma americanum TaxID=6943 RepID=A0AAQ4F677_AMBAM